MNPAESKTPTNASSPSAPGDRCDREPACPACGGSLIQIRQKFQCARCHRICETCCEGGQG